MIFDSATLNIVLMVFISLNSVPGLLNRGKERGIFILFFIHFKRIPDSLIAANRLDITFHS